MLELDLKSLELSRLRADLTLTYTILFGLIDVDSNTFLTYITAHYCVATFTDYAATHNGLIQVFTSLVSVLQLHGTHYQ